MLGVLEKQDLEDEDYEWVHNSLEKLNRENEYKDPFETFLTKLDLKYESERVELLADLRKGAKHSIKSIKKLEEQRTHSRRVEKLDSEWAWYQMWRD